MGRRRTARACGAIFSSGRSLLYCARSGIGPQPSGGACNERTREAALRRGAAAGCHAKACLFVRVEACGAPHLRAMRVRDAACEAPARARVAGLRRRKLRPADLCEVEAVRPSFLGTKPSARRTSVRFSLPQGAAAPRRPPRDRIFTATHKEREPPLRRGRLSSSSGSARCEGIYSLICMCLIRRRRHV